MDADNPTIRWSSNAPSIVSVVEDSTDIVTIKGVQEGNAIIKAAATDGSGVEATCNVVVKPAGPTPYPADADIYVKSVQNYKIAHNSPYRLLLEDENGENLTLAYSIDLNNYNLIKDSNAAIVGKIGEKLLNGETYTIGSLEDKSYLRITRSSSSTVSTRIYTENNDIIALIPSYNSAGQPRSKINSQYIYVDNNRKMYFIETYAGREQMCYTDFSSNNNTPNSYRISGSYAYAKDSSGQDVKRTNFTIKQKLHEVKLIKDGITTSDYYYYLGNDDMMAKIGKIDGSYLCFDEYGSPVSEEDFPEGTETILEYTFDIS